MEGGMPSSEGDFSAVHSASAAAVAAGRMQQQPQPPTDAAAAAAAATGKKKTTGPIHNPRYKSIMCDHWERSGGTCPYAEKCQFAHGPAELAKWQSHRARQQGGVPAQAPAPVSVIPQQQAMAAAPQSIAAFVSPVKPQQQQQYVVQYAPNGAGRMTPMKDPSSSYAMQQQQQQQQAPGEYAPSAYYAYAAQPPPQQPPQQQQMSFQPSQGSYSYQQPMYSNKGLLAPQPSLVHQHHPQQQQHGSTTTGARAPSPLLYHHPQSEASLYYAQQTGGGGYMQQQQQAPRQAESYVRQQPQQQQQQPPPIQVPTSRQTPAGSLSSTPPAASPFPLVGYGGRPQSSASRRSVSPDTQQSLDVLSYPEILGDAPVPRSASDPRRTASLPQLFSKDFLNSLNGESLTYSGSSSSGNNGGGGGGGSANGNGQSLSSSSHQNSGGAHNNNGGGGMMGFGGGGQSDAMRAMSGGGHMNGGGASGGSSYLRPSPSPPMYPTSRRGSAPPVVLSVVTNSIGDYNSLADLDSLADDLVSEPATASHQLFNMPTVFPGSIRSASQASVSSSSSAAALHQQQQMQQLPQGNSINEYL